MCTDIADCSLPIVNFAYSFLSELTGFVCAAL